MKTYESNEYDVIVVGAGHAGVESALALPIGQIAALATVAAIGIATATAESISLFLRVLCFVCVCVCVCVCSPLIFFVL